MNYMSTSLKYVSMDIFIWSDELSLDRLFDGGLTD